MNKRRLLAELAFVIFLGCSGENDPSRPTGPDDLGPVTSITISPPTPAVTAGNTIQLAATGKDASGRTVPGLALAWSTNATLLARVTGSGEVTGVSVGRPTVTVRELASGARGTTTLSVTAPSRPAGSLLIVASESVVQTGAPLLLSVLGLVDTASTGSDHRIGIVHVELGVSSLNPPIARASFPLLSAITECPNGDVFAASHQANPGQNPADLWRITLTTGIATEALSDPFGTSSTVTGMACDSENELLVVVRGSVGMRLLYRVTPASGRVAFVRDYLATYPEAIAVSPNGSVYATIREAFAATTGQLLATVDPITGRWSSVNANQPYRPTILHSMVFRGDRLLGFAMGDLVEVDVETGETSRIRVIDVP